MEELSNTESFSKESKAEISFRILANNMIFREQNNTVDTIISAFVFVYLYKPTKLAIAENVARGSLRMSKFRKA